MEFRIDERFCGPPRTANGGYLGGRLAALVGGSAEVTFRRATPLERSLRVERVANGVDLYDGDALCATARQADVDVSAPGSVSIEAARDGARGFPRWVDHPIPRCYVCGPERPPGDGLCIFPGPVPGREEIYAAAWTPDASIADAGGVVFDEHHWGALDCTGAFAVNEPPRGVALLGKFAAKIVRRVRVGEEVAVAGWPIATDGRKLHAGTAIYSGTGELCAVARALWILT